MPKLNEPCVVCGSSPFHRLGCPVLNRLTLQAGVFFLVVTVAGVGWWAFTNAAVKPAYPAAAAIFCLIYGGLSLRRSSRFEAEKRALEATRKPTARNPKADRLWWSLGSHLLVAAALVLVATTLVATDYVGGDGSYSCNSALEDFMGPRPVESDSEFFDAGPPCWDEAKSRILTAAVLIPLMVAAWAARCIALSHRRPRGPFVSAFVVLTVIGLYSGYL